MLVCEGVNYRIMIEWYVYFVILECFFVFLSCVRLKWVLNCNIIYSKNIDYVCEIFYD